MSEKRDFNLEGISWCFAATEQNSDILKAKYKKGQDCNVRAQKNNPNRANVYAGGNALIGFLNEFEFYWVQQKREEGNKIYAQTYKVENAEYIADMKVTLRLQTFPFSKKTPKQSQATRPSIARPITIKKPRTLAVKHPITNKAFKAQKDLNSVCRNLAGRIGIYCIYSKDFSTYIGQSVDIGNRIRSHINDLKAGRHHNAQLQADWNKYGHGYFTFQQVELCSVTELDEREHYYICAYKTFEYGYNATEDGQPPALPPKQNPSIEEDTDDLTDFDGGVFVDTTNPFNSPVFSSSTTELGNNHVEKKVPLVSDNLYGNNASITTEVAELVVTPVISSTESPKPDISMMTGNNHSQVKALTIEQSSAAPPNTASVNSSYAHKKVINNQLFSELFEQATEMHDTAKSLYVRCSIWFADNLGYNSTSKTELKSEVEKLKNRVHWNNLHLSSDHLTQLNNVIDHIEKLIQK